MVARGLSLVSAAQSSDDAGFGDLDLEPEIVDAGSASPDGAVEKPFDFGHVKPGPRPLPPSPPAPAVPSHQDGHGDAHDKDDKDEPGAAHDAGPTGFVKNH